MPTYAAIVSTAHTAVTFPLSYYSTFVLPHRYGLSVQSLRGWLSDQGKRAALGAVLGLPLMDGLYWLLRTAPDIWWIAAGAGMLAVTVGLSALAPILILPPLLQAHPPRRCGASGTSVQGWRSAGHLQTVAQGLRDKGQDE